MSTDSARPSCLHHQHVSISADFAKSGNCVRSLKVGQSCRCKLAALCGGASTAYLVGPHWVQGKVVAPEGKPFHIEGFSGPQPYYHYTEDRSPLPWFGIRDPILAKLTASQTKLSTKDLDAPQAKLFIKDLDALADFVGKSD